MKFTVHILVPKTGLVQHVIRADTWEAAHDRAMRAYPRASVAAIYSERVNMAGKLVQRVHYGSLDAVRARKGQAA